MSTLTVAAKPPECEPQADPPRPIDLVHLARMTLGDRSIEREVLQLFARQSANLQTRMVEAAPIMVSGLAHTLKGSARGVGAWRVATAAEAVELATAGSGPALQAAIADLGTAVQEANALIADLLKAH